MRTLIVLDHVVQVAARPITQLSATAISALLRDAEHIPVTAAVAFDGSVDLYAVGPVSTRDEVHALRAFAAVTDAPLRWHEGVR